MRNYSRFRDLFTFPSIGFQIKKLVHIVENKSNKYMNNIVYDFFVLKILKLDEYLGSFC